jgi:hypothetical protein
MTKYSVDFLLLQETFAFSMDISKIKIFFANYNVFISAKSYAITQMNLKNHILKIEKEEQ